MLTSDACACTVTGYGVTQDSCGQCLEGSFSASTEEDEVEIVEYKSFEFKAKYHPD